MGLPPNIWKQKGTAMTPVPLWSLFPCKGCKSLSTDLKKRKKLAMLLKDKVEGIITSEGDRHGLSSQSHHLIIKLGQPCDLTGTLVPFFVKYNQISFLIGLLMVCVRCHR